MKHFKKKQQSRIKLNFVYDSGLVGQLSEKIPCSARLVSLHQSLYSLLPLYPPQSSLALTTIRIASHGLSPQPILAYPPRRVFLSNLCHPFRKQSKEAGKSGNAFREKR